MATGRWNPLGGAAVLSIAGLMVLSACEERPYPSPTHGEAPSAPPPTALMGAPDQGSPYTPPPAPEGAYAPAPEAPAYAPPRPYAASGYEGGAVVAMAPIPNPGDPGSEPYYGDYQAHHHHNRYGHAWVDHRAAASPYGEVHPASGRHPLYVYAAPSHPAYAWSSHARPLRRWTPVHARAAAPRAAVVAANGTKTTTVVKTAPPVIAAPKLPAVVAFDSKGVAHKSAALAAATGVAAGSMAHHTKASSQAKTSEDKAGAPADDRAARLAALQSALTDAVGKGAMLTAPASFTANQPTDVTLVLPADFADALRGEAQKDGLGDAAASVNMTALLSGEGFAVSPDDTQSAPLTAGQATEFHWTVTAQPGAKGPLHADVGADLLGGGSDKLALGSVQKTADLGVKVTSRVVGASLLVLITALVVAWLARARGPTRSAAARRAARQAARGGRPLDMTSDGQGTL